MSDLTGFPAAGARSAVVAILLPIYGRWFDLHWYAATFISLSVIPILGTALWWWIGRNGSRSVAG